MNARTTTQWSLLRCDRLLRFGILSPLGPPFLRLIWLVRGGGQLDQPVEGFGDAGFADFGDRLLALLHPLVALEQERLGRSVLLLAQERPAEHGHRVERVPGVRLRLLADGQALAEKGFG